MPLLALLGVLGQSTCEVGKYQNASGSCIDCEPGYWCVAAQRIPCAYNTFNSFGNMGDMTACKSCPMHTKSWTVASTSIDDCLCDDGYFDVMPGFGVMCLPCKVGMQCQGGATLERLPLAPGFWRPSSLSQNVRRCPDAAVGCERTGSATCNVSLSGCRVGEDFTTSCAPSSGLSGPLCRRCDDNGTERVYYQPAVSALGTPSHCASCTRPKDVIADTIGFYVGFGVAILLAIFVFYASGLAARLERYLKVVPLSVAATDQAKEIERIWRKRWLRFWLASRPGTKLKILLSFYLIATNIDEVYEVTMPSDVRQLLHSFMSASSFGLSSSTMILTCMGWKGYAYKIAVWILGPLVFALCIVLGALALILHRRASARFWVLEQAQQKATEMVARTGLTKGGSSTTSRSMGKRSMRLLLRNPKEGQHDRPLTLKRLLVQLLVDSGPVLIRFQWLIYPIITNVAFSAYSCDEFQTDNISVLISDVSVYCQVDGETTPEYQPVRNLAHVAVALYSAGLFVLNAVLLLVARRSILSGHETPLTRAIRFIYKEFDTSSLWWELMEMLRRFVLVGVMVLWYRGSVTQLVAATVLSSIFLCIQMTVRPYEDPGDDMFAHACGFALVIIFVTCTMFKVATLTELPEFQSRMTIEQNYDFVIPTTTLSILLILCIFFVILAFVWVLAQTLAKEGLKKAKELRAERARRLRNLKDGAEVLLKELTGDGKASLDDRLRALYADPSPAPTVPAAGPFHIFLSHNWRHGQSAMRILQTRLTEMLPDIKVFLDVDNLGGGKDHPHIDVSECVLCFCTRRWFINKPCVRELVRSYLRNKPCIALLELDTEFNGGQSEAKCREVLNSTEYAERLQRDMAPQLEEWRREWGKPDLQLPTGAQLEAHLFKYAPIVWYRLSDLQDVTMRCIAERLVEGYEHLHDAKYEQIAYVSGELEQREKLERVQYHRALGEGRTIHLYCSEYNPGAVEVAKELQTVSDGAITHTTDFERLDECEHMLVLLTEATWTRGREGGEEFIEEVVEAMKKGVHRLLIHEVLGTDGDKRQACPFERFFEIDTTPKSLIKAGIYADEVAMNLAGGQWRKSGLIKTLQTISQGSGERRPSLTVVKEIAQEQQGGSRNSMSERGGDNEEEEEAKESWEPERSVRRFRLSGWRALRMGMGMRREMRKVYAAETVEEMKP